MLLAAAGEEKEEARMLDEGNSFSGQLQQLAYYQQSYSPSRKEQQPLFLSATVCLLLAFLLAVWGDIAIHVPSSMQRPTTLVTPGVQSLNPTTLITPSLQSPTPIVTPNLQNTAIASQVDSLLATLFRDKQFSGSVLIARDSAVLFSNGYGMADWHQRLPNTPHTKFHIGSLTKEFTAVAILLLQEQGKLHIQDHLCSYIAHCPQAWQPVTIYQVLTHTSGIPEVFGSISSPEQWIATYTNVPLNSRPGTQFSYCNVCYQILGYLIQKISGQPYTRFLQHAIFDPLQMKNTGFDPRYSSLPDHATGYIHWQVAAVPVDWSVLPTMSFLLGAGLLYTTNEDLFLWDQALFYTHVLFPQQSLDEIFTPASATPAHQYGWFIGQSASHSRFIWHYGIVDGFRAYIGRYPNDKVSIIILSNLDALDVPTLASALEQVIFAT